MTASDPKPAPSRSIIQCPLCGFKVTERLPAGKAPSTADCVACGKAMQARGCCVFCDFGSVRCRAASCSL
ncbi:GDCCVxC domain-containing (seleno)protein [Litorivivens lipolytica]|uniref:GDCCVxC domain-containing (seleno)protein n=1 Tax=Litorivivens lipolytica TaxID=1524264 RepID=UPI003CCDA344